MSDVRERTPWWKVALAAIAYFAIGSIWYGFLFPGPPQIAQYGGPGLYMTIQAILGVLFVLGIDWVLRVRKSAGLGDMLKALALVLLLIVLPANGGQVGEPVALLIDLLYYAIGMTAIGLIVKRNRRSA